MRSLLVWGTACALLLATGCAGPNRLRPAASRPAQPAGGGSVTARPHPGWPYADGPGPRSSNRFLELARTGTRDAWRAECWRAAAAVPVRLETPRSTAISLNNRAVARNSLGEHRAAIADTTAALEADPAYALAYNTRGAAHFLLGEVDAAARDYTRAIDLGHPDPRRHSAFYANRAGLRFERGEFLAGARDLDEALRLDPRNGAAYARLGVALRRRGETTLALETYAAGMAVARDPRDLARLHYDRAALRQDLGDPLGAADDVRAALGLRPDYPQALALKARLEALLGPGLLQLGVHE